MSQTMTENKTPDVKSINKWIANQIRWKTRLAKYNKQLAEGTALEELGLSESELQIFEKNKFQSRSKFGRECHLFDRKLVMMAERKIREFQHEKAVLTITALRSALEHCTPAPDTVESVRFALDQAREFLKEGQSSESKSVS